LAWMMITLYTMKAEFPVIINGKDCPEVKGVAHFNVSRYLGQWFQLSALPCAFIEAKSTCVWSEYDLLPNGDVNVNNWYVNNGKKTVMAGKAAPNENGFGELDLEFYKTPNTTAIPNYYVLDTDYNEFIYAWHCSNLIGAHTPILWILNREYNHTQNYTAQQVSNALNILVKAFGYDVDSATEVYGLMVTTNQTNCDYDFRKRRSGNGRLYKRTDKR